MSQEHITVDVLVLGAGAAGLAAAARLESGRASILVLEGRARIGGRIDTVQTASDGQPLWLDLGAQWIHGDDPADNPIAHLTAARGIQTIATCPLENTLYTSTGYHIEEQLHDGWRQLFEEQFSTFAAQQQKGGCLHSSATVADLLGEFVHQNQQLDASDKHGLEYLVNTRIEQEYGADAADLSAAYYDYDQPCNGNHALFPQGFSQVVTALAEPIQQHILLQHHVQHIQYTSEGVTVHAKTPVGPKTFTARCAIVTFPLGVLKKHSSRMFEPPLSADKTAAIQRLGCGLLNKVILVYDDVFWAPTAWLNRMPTPDHCWQNRWQEFFNVSKYMPDVPVLVAFSAARPAWEAEQDSDEVIIQQVTSVLADMYSQHAAIAKSPQQVWITRWGSDPYALGSYACMAKDSSPADIAALAAPEGTTLFFAGEAMSDRNQGTVHGAYATGIDAADAVLRQLELQGCAVGSVAPAGTAARVVNERGVHEGLDNGRQGCKSARGLQGSSKAARQEALGALA